MGIVPAPALVAVEKQLAILRSGPSGQGWGAYVDAFEAPIETARSEARRLLGARADEVGLIGDTTSGLHQAIDAIPFRAGDNVVLSDLEYPQVALAAKNAAREQEVEIRFVPHRDGRLSIDDYRAAIDARTRAVLVSSVGWVTGQRLDLAAFSTLAEERDLFLVVDAVQQLGGISLDCSALRIDFLMAGGYKWLNAPFATGLLYVRRGAHERGLRLRRVGLLGLEPPAMGWNSFYDHPNMRPLPALEPQRSIRRFEAQGTPNRLGSAGLAAALRYRNELPSVDDHILGLGAELMAGLEARGARILTPRENGERAGIVAFTFGDGPGGDKALRDALENESIYVGARYCSGVGGLRAAVHYFNQASDLGRLLNGIDRFREQ